MLYLFSDWVIRGEVIVWHVLAVDRWVVARAFGVCSGGPGRDDRVGMMGDDRVERERGVD